MTPTPSIVVKKPNAGLIWSTPTNSVTMTDKLELNTPEREMCIIRLFAYSKGVISGRGSAISSVKEGKSGFYS